MVFTRVLFRRGGLKTGEGYSWESGPAMSVRIRVAVRVLGVVLF